VGRSLGRDLAELRTDLLRDLGLHQLAGDEGDCLEHEVAVLAGETRSTTSATAILWPSAIVALPSSISGRTDESGARGGRMSGSSWNFGGDPHG